MTRFGEQLRVWLDTLLLGQEEFADKCTLHQSYIRALLAGKGKSGIDTPGRGNQDKIFAQLGKENAKALGDAAWENAAPMTSLQFWRGPDGTRTSSGATGPTDLEETIARDFTWRGRKLSPEDLEAVRTTVRTLMGVIRPQR